MSKFHTMHDVTSYPALKFYPRPWQVTFRLDVNVTPLIPHIVMRITPPNQVCYEVPFTLRDARRLRDWLNTYINDREGILR